MLGFASLQTVKYYAVLFFTSHDLARERAVIRGKAFVLLSRHGKLSR
jgi:hypothetical protein